MNERKVSVIVPIYNREQYLERCLNSLLMQTYSNYEVICVDDGSTDKSGAICDEFASKDNRIRVVHTPNSGVSHARNMGLEMVSGQYILFVDSDDWVEKTFIQNMLPEGCEDLVYSGYQKYCNGVYSDTISVCAEYLYAAEWKSDFKRFWNCHPLTSVWRGCYKSSIIHSNSLRFCEFQVAEDLLFNLTYLEYCQSIRFSAASCYCYEAGDHASLMRRYIDNRLQIEIEVCKQLELISGKEEPELRWFCWHSVMRHLSKWYINEHRCLRKKIYRKQQECYKNDYFRKCLPYIRKNGSLDERIETYFMSYPLHRLYKPIYRAVLLASKAKRFLVRQK